MSQETATEWLINKIESNGEINIWENASVQRIQISINVYEYLELKRQAKEMERKQHETTFHRGINVGALNPELDIQGRKESAKHYYESMFTDLNS